MDVGPQPHPAPRIWQVGHAEFDEARRELRVGSQLRTVEAKPLAVFYELLCRAGEVATKHELMAAVWPDVNVVDGSLPTAIGKLRTALGDEGRTIVEAVPRVGYRIGVPIVLARSPEKLRLAFGFSPGDTVPNRPQWRLDRPLGPAADVWLARHVRTAEQRVFKFADTADRLDALKREAALSRILHASLGDRPDFVRMTEWNFESRPFFVESAYGGPSLPEWAEARGGLPAVPLAERVELATRIVRTAADAHAVGVLHGDIKPANVVVDTTTPGLAATRLVDFGAGRLTDAARIEAASATLMAMAEPGARFKSGTFLYMAPEVLRGDATTTAADVYALGVLLYQLITGDFERLLAPGWESDVADDLLRQDVADAAAGDTLRRIPSAQLLATRLETLEPRRLAAQAETRKRREEEERQAENEQLLRDLDLRRLESEAAARKTAHAVELARRTRLAALALLVLLAAASGLAAFAVREQRVARAQRDRAEHIGGIAQDTVSALVIDLAHGLVDQSGMQLPIVEKLLDQAQRTLGGMRALAPDNRQLRGLEARSLTEFAVAYMHEGDLAKAEAAIDRSADIGRDLLRGDAADVGALVDMARTQRWLGDIRFKKRDLNGAMQAYKAAIAALDRPIAAAPKNGELQQWLARNEDCVGDVHLQQGDSKAALAIYRVAMTLLTEGLSRHLSDPAWRLDVSTSNEKIGDALEALGDSRGALAAYQAGLVLREPLLHIDSSNLRWQRAVAVSHADIGDEQMALHDWPAALLSYRLALTLNRNRALGDPSNTQWQSDVASSDTKIGAAEDALGHPAEAETSFREALSIMARVTQDSPANVGFAEETMVIQTDLANTLLHKGDEAGGKMFAEAAVNSGRKLLAHHPDDTELASDLKAAQSAAQSAAQPAARAASLQP